MKKKTDCKKHHINIGLFISTGQHTKFEFFFFHFNMTITETKQNYVGDFVIFVNKNLFMVMEV